MIERRNVFILLGATMILATSLWAATQPPPADPPPTAPTVPAFETMPSCATDVIKGEMSCKGKLVGLGTEPVTLRIDALGQCLQRDKLAPVMTLRGENANLQTTSGSLTFEKLSTKPPTATECAATQPVDFSHSGVVTVEQPKGTRVIQLPVEVFP